MKKKVLVILTLMISIGINSQVLNYNDLENGIKPESPFTSYICSNGKEYKIGDKIKIGKPSLQTKLFILKTNHQFAFIKTGYAIALLPPNTPLQNENSGKNVIIKKFIVRGFKKSGYKVYVLTENVDLIMTYLIDVENAIDSGEIK